MRERAFATIFIWIASMFGIDRLIASVRYTEIIANPNFIPPDLSGITDPNIAQNLMFSMYSNSTIMQTTWAPTWWVIAVVGLIALIVIIAGIATAAMWTTRHGTSPEEQTAREAAKRLKTKRNDPAREARVRHLLETLEDDELAALEAGEIGDDGERVTLEALLRRR